MKQKTVFKGLAGAAAMAGATQAYGTVIVDTNPANITGHAPAATDNGTRTYIDVDGNQSAQGGSSAASFTGVDLQIRYRNLTETGGSFLLAYVYAYNGGSTVGTTLGSSGAAYAYNLAAGTSIGSASSFYQKTGYLTHIVTNYAGTDYGFGTTGAKEYLGFSFISGTQTDYGYLELEVDPYVSAASPGGIQFLKLGYDNSGASILAGANGVAAVPEPGTLGALAFGAATFAGVAAKRRQRNRAARA